MMFAAFAAMMMAACSQSEKGYVINGTAEGFEDGDSVILSEAAFNADGVVVSSTVIKDGKFEFKGQPVGVKPMALVVKHGGEEVAIQTIIVEDNTVSVVLRPGEDAGTVEGGETQRLFNEFNNTLNAYIVQLEALSMNLSDSTLEETKKGEIMQQIDSLSGEMDSVGIQFIIDQMPSEFSNLVFVAPSHVLSKEKLQRLLDAFAEKQPDAPNYKKYLEENK